MAAPGWSRCTEANIEAASPDNQPRRRVCDGVDFGVKSVAARLVFGLPDAKTAAFSVLFYKVLTLVMADKVHPDSVHCALHAPHPAVCVQSDFGEQVLMKLHTMVP